MNVDNYISGSIDCIFSLMMNFVFVTWKFFCCPLKGFHYSDNVTMAISSLVPILFASDHESWYDEVLANHLTWFRNQRTQPRRSWGELSWTNTEEKVHCPIVQLSIHWSWHKYLYGDPMLNWRGISTAGSVSYNQLRGSHVRPPLLFMSSSRIVRKLNTYRVVFLMVRP